MEMFNVSGFQLYILCLHGDVEVLIENRSSEAALLGSAAAEMTGNESINEKAHDFANQYAETVRDVVAAIPLPLAAASRWSP